MLGAPQTYEYEPERIQANLPQEGNNAFQRGSIVLADIGNAANPGWSQYRLQFLRPPELAPPNFMLLECHTTGTKNRALGSDAERSVWSLMLDNS